jgi:hypothetical protein
LFFALTREFSFSGEVTNNKTKIGTHMTEPIQSKKKKEESPNSRRE